MTPYLEKGGKSLIFDRRFRHVGRIKRASGTLDADELRQINEAFTAIAEMDPPRLDILRAVQDRVYTPREVWQAHRKQRLDTLVSSKNTRALLDQAMTSWIDGYTCGDDHRRSLRGSLGYLVKAGGKRATIEDLPRLLEKLRPTMLAAGNARTFNLARSAAQAFVRSTLKRSNPLWLEISSIETLPVKKTREGNPQSPDELRVLMAKMHPRHAQIAWAMAVAGMGPKEYWGRWEVRGDRVLVHGTKREARDRFVPLVDASIAKPSVLYRAFQKAIGAASNWTVEPYDMRRSFATWMEDAGIPRTRRRMYMGHGEKDVTDIYEKRDISRFLLEDASRLRKHVGAIEKPSLHIMKGGAS